MEINVGKILNSTITISGAVRYAGMLLLKTEIKYHKEMGKTTLVQISKKNDGYLS